MEDSDLKEIAIDLTPSMSSIFFKASVKVGAYIVKGEKLGLFSVNVKNNFSQKLFAETSGLIKWIETDIAKDLLKDKGENTSPIIVAKMEPCKHQLTYNGVCTDCGEMTSDKSGHLIYSEIKNLRAETRSAIDMHTASLERQKKLMMVLDLDNTVVHAMRVKPELRKDYEKLEEVKILDIGGKDTYALKLRPHLKFFLKKILPAFEVYVYTFGTREYAEQVIAYINDGETLIDVN